MKVHTPLYKVVYSLTAIATTLSMAAPGMSQVLESGSNRQLRPDASPVPIQSVEPDVETSDTFLNAPLDAETVEGELPADDPWFTFCLLNTEPGEEFGNCINKLPPPSDQNNE